MPTKKVRDEVEELFDDPEDIDEDEEDEEDEVVDIEDDIDVDSYIRSHNLDELEFEELDVEEFEDGDDD